MVDRATFYDIIDSIGSANGPDRSIDQAVMGLFYVRDRRYIGAHECGPDDKYVSVKSDVWVDPSTDKFVTTDPCGFDFTSSLDRAVQLCERVLPGCVWTLSNSDGHGYRAAKVRLNPLRSIAGAESTVPLALLAATLKALVVEGAK